MIYHKDFIVDTKGNLSKQMDIIIYDSAKTPVFFQSGSTRIIPVECGPYNENHKMRDEIK